MLMMLGRSVHTTQKNPEVLVVTSKEIGLAVIVHKTKYVVRPRDRNSGCCHNMRIHNGSFAGWKSSNIWEQT